MSWISLAHVMPCQQPMTTHLPAILPAGTRARGAATRPVAATGQGGDSAARSGLGAARAGVTWRWASPASPVVQASGVRRAPAMAPGATPIAVPERLLRAMRAAACASGRSESEVWAEAAREWLRQRQQDDGPLPPPAAAALAIPRRARSWSAIDVVLADLRQPRRSAAA